MPASSKVLVAIAVAASMLINVPIVGAKIYRFASNAPENTMRGHIEDLYLSEVERLSGGEIKIQRFWAQSLVKGKEILKSVQDGVADFGFINPAYYPKRLLLLNGTMLVDQGPSSSENMIAAYKDIYDQVPGIKDELSKYKQHMVFMYTGTPYSFISRTPLKSTDDLKGKKARSSSRWKMADFQALGATPVSVAFPECYMALQTGTIDTVLTNVDAQDRGKLYEVAPNLWVWDHMWLAMPFLVSINDKSYQKLSPKGKAAVDGAMQSIIAKVHDLYREELKKSLDVMKQSGVTITHASKADYDVWFKLPSHEKNKATWIREAGAAGVKDAPGAYQKIVEIVAAYVAREA